MYRSSGKQLIYTICFSTYITYVTVSIIKYLPQKRLCVDRYANYRQNALFCTLRSANALQSVIFNTFYFFIIMKTRYVINSYATLTFEILTPKLTVSCPCPVDQLCQHASKSVDSFFKYRVVNYVDRQTYTSLYFTIQW